MAHQQQRDFCESVKARFAQFFSKTMVLDIGSLDINGNNQYLFDAESLYLGIDVAPGRNVDVVCAAHELALPDATFDVIVSTECLEHDRHWAESLKNALRMLRPGGLLLVTCATTGRAEHGTRRTTPHDAPLLAEVDGEWADYYRNLEEADIRSVIDIQSVFQVAEFSIGHETHDLYFFGIKQGTFEKRANRSTSLESSVRQIAEAELKAKIDALEKQHAEDQHRLRTAQDNLAQMWATIDQEKTRQFAVSDELSRVYRSKSWRITHPLRVTMTQVGKAQTFTARANNALRYVTRGDFDGLNKRIRAIRANKPLGKLALAGATGRWAIMATPHVLFIAHLIASRLRAREIEADILTSAPPGFPHAMYIVICPQMFTELPPGDRRIAYQMEQSVSSRWFTEEYLKTLNNSLAVLEYSLVNLEFMATKGISYPHVHYLPVGTDAEYMRHLAPVEKSYDVLFYGDANSSVRRRAMLETLRKHFHVHECSEIFGAEIVDEIRRARIVINLHYYENALLEMPRIQECLSLGVPVVSESAQDQMDYPEIANAVVFFNQGDEQAMIKAVRAALDQGIQQETIQQAAVLGAERFTFMFDRFLVAMSLLPASHLANDGLPVPHNASRIALSMPETIARRRIFEANRPQDCTTFDGVRLRPAWVGCGLSYSSLARHALKYGVNRLTIFEDDVLLPDDFEEKMRIVHAYLDANNEKWDVFSGVIACLHKEARVLHVERFQGMDFITIDKMTSMVCNIYSENALRILATWDASHRNDQTNTIDKYLERQSSLRVVVALPFLVGHREEVHSTLWGFQNTQYVDLIAASEKELMGLFTKGNSQSKCAKSSDNT